MAVLAINGGKPVIEKENEKLFHWPIVTQEDIQAVTEVLEAGSMSGSDITKQFEKEYAAWNGTKYALGTCNGTAALLAAMWACGVGAGDEVIAPALTYWATALPAISLGANADNYSSYHYRRKVKRYNTRSELSQNRSLRRPPQARKVSKRPFF